MVCAIMKQYLYCFSSLERLGVFRMGFTCENPIVMRDRLNLDAPYPYVIEFGKEVDSPVCKPASLYAMLDASGARFGVNVGWWSFPQNFILPEFEFVYYTGKWFAMVQCSANSIVPSIVAPIEIKTQHISDVVPEYKSDDNSDEDDTLDPREPKPKKFLPNMLDYFNHSQQIRHSRGSIITPWVGTYNAVSNAIVCKGVSYSTMSAFATAHYENENLNRKGSGWVECEYEDSREGWKPTKNMPRRV